MPLLLAAMPSFRATCEDEVQDFGSDPGAPGERLGYLDAGDAVRHAVGLLAVGDTADVKHCWRWSTRCIGRVTLTFESWRQPGTWRTSRTRWTGSRSLVMRTVGCPDHFWSGETSTVQLNLPKQSPPIPPSMTAWPRSRTSHKNGPSRRQQLRTRRPCLRRARRGLLVRLCSWLLPLWRMPCAAT